jgi:hypothetical protein
MQQDFEWLCMQGDALLHYTWDISLTSNMANNTNLNLSAIGITTFSPVKDCNDGFCAKFVSGTHFKLPTYRYAQQSGLTVAMWIKPSNESGAGSRIFEMSDADGTTSVAMYRNGTSSKLGFSVKRGGSTSMFVTVENNTWKSWAWQHVVWTLGSESGAFGQPVWNIYIDGSLTATVDGLYPSSVDLDSSYIGRAKSAGQGQYLGYMDSFMVFQHELSGNEARLIFLVSTFVFTSLAVFRARHIRFPLCLADFPSS